LLTIVERHQFIKGGFRQLKNSCIYKEKLETCMKNMERIEVKQKVRRNLIKWN
jgi:hypothetical protein